MPRAQKLLRDGWERLTMYLPVLLMGLLALGSYWLLRNTPVFSTPDAPAAPRHEADYFMRRFAVKTFDAGGKLKSEVASIKGRHYPDTDTLEIDRVRIRSITPEGRVTTATANRALSNADGSEVQLFGNAIVVREPMTDGSGRALPRMEFRGEFLHAFMNTEQVRSHLPVTLIRGNDRFTGDSMQYDNLDGVMDLRGRVRGVLQPAGQR